jgi:hypothetical protein
MARVAILACDQAVEQAAATQADAPSSMIGEKVAVNGNMYGRLATVDPPAVLYRQTLTRRRILERLLQIQTGLIGSPENQSKGIMVATEKPEDRQVVDDVVKHIHVVQQLSKHGQRSSLAGLLDQTTHAVKKLEEALGIQPEN